MNDVLIGIAVVAVLLLPLLALGLFVLAWRRPAKRGRWAVAALLVLLAYVWFEGPALQSLVWQIVVWRMER